MKKTRLVSGLLAAALLLGAPGVIQTAKAVSADGEAVSAPTTSSYEVKVTANSLTIRAKANKSSTIKGYLSKGDVVTIVDEEEDSRGYTWGKLASGKGWISLRYTNWSGASDDDTSSKVNYQVKVTANSLAIRAKANKSSTIKGYLSKDKVVTIVEEQDDSRGYTWGKLSDGRGWISLRYTSAVSSDGTVDVNYKVKVTASSLNVRAKASSSSSIVGALSKGDVVRIVAEKDDSKGKTWGKLSDGSGWIYLSYTSKVTSSSFASYQVKVTVDTLNIRKEADKDSAGVGFLRKGNVMTIVAEQTDERGYTWGKLENGDGWISLRYTQKVSSTPVFAQYKVKVTVSSLRVRASASTSSAITGGLTKGDVVTIVAEKNGWGKLSNGTGWIYLGYTTKV